MKINTALFLLAFGCVSLLCCKSDNSTTAESLAKNELESARKGYKDQPSPMSATALISQLSKKLSRPDISKSDRLSLLEEGLKVSNEQNITARKGNFLFPLIKDYYSDGSTADRIFNLAETMSQMKKTSAANVLYTGLVSHFPNFSKLDVAKSKVADMEEPIEEYIKKLGEGIFENPDEIGVNRKASLSYVDACEAFGLVNPDHDQTPEILFKAAEVAKSIRTFPKSLSLYDWIINSYPNYEKAPTAMFLKGFIIENNIKDDSLALKVYQEFIAKYPDHNLNDDAQFLIENIGKTDEEILQMIESKRKENTDSN